VGGGIYTKAADVGADLVGKVEVGIPEDDPRNPAVIADNVGDNVGDCAGMAADLFETYVVTALAAMLLAVTPIVLNKFGLNALIFPLAIGAVAIFGTIVGSFFVRLGKGRGIMTAMYKGVVATTIVSAIGFFFINQILMGGNLGIYVATLVGLAVMAFMVVNSEIFTSMKFGSVKMVAKASQTGAATNVIAGLGIGLRSTLPPAIAIVTGILVSYFLGGGFEDPALGIFGVSIAAAAMLSTTGMIVAIDSYGPITDNAGGIAEMSGLPKEVRDVTDSLDAVGNTTKAVTKGYAIGSAALAALSLFAAYREEVTRAAGLAIGSLTFSLEDPLVLVGLLLGAAIPFFFSSSLMLAVGKAASDVVQEVRRQFKEIPGIMEGKANPQYGKCVDIVTRSALREFSIPALVAVAAPLLVGFILGPKALGGLLLGTIIAGLLMALLMTTGGATWDNAKKYVEAGNLGGKKTPTHAAAVVGDTVGDPFKDTAGPSINPLIKVVNMLAILFAVLIVTNNLLSIAG
ncbi:MAG: sodium-translocating pyrophosphatase, partial [Candidatus Bathyarchaeia archaeon]